MESTAERLSLAKKASGLSYAQLETMTGVSRSTLQRYISRKTDKIPIDAIEAIAPALGVSAEYLMGWDGEVSDSEKIAQLEYELLSITLKRKPTDEEAKSFSDICSVVLGELRRKGK